LALAAAVVVLAAAGPATQALAGTAVRDPGVRIALVIALLAPIGFVLGMPFPLKLRSLAGELAVLVPWAWAVNGFASVLGSVLAIVIAMNFGFRVLFATAAACYVVAFVAHAASRRARPLW
jgi:hypothetical protein